MPPGDLNPLERTVLEQTARGHAKEAALRAQLALARVTSRTWTGPGFYTYFEAPCEVDAIVLAGAVIEFYDGSEDGVSGFEPPAPSWAKAGQP